MDKDMKLVDIYAANSTWSDVILGHALNFPDRPALAFKDTSINYGQLNAMVEECAGYLSRMGLGKGDCMALLSPPRQEAMITLLAAARLGALWVGLNPRYQVRELNYVIQHARPKLVLSVTGFEGRDYTADLQASLHGMDAGTVPEIIFYDAAEPTADTLFDALARHAEPNEPLAGAVPCLGKAMDPCMLVYTSGTTGKPKGVLLRQRDLIFRSTAQARMFKTANYPVVINFAPINHIGGMHFRGLSQILAGGTIVYQDRYRTADVMGLIAKHRVNMLMLGSTMLQMLLAEPTFDIQVLKKMEWFIFSGSAIPMPILKTIRQYCPKTGSTYGLTESCGSVSYIDRSDSIEDTAYTIGRPVPDGELRVADERGLLLPDGEQGELQVRMEHCMAGYLRDEAATHDAFTPDGWLKTGDMAVRQGNGYFKLVGRIKEMYKSGGYNVYPREVELVLEQHPSVMLSAVIAVDDILYQQVGHAYVIIKPDTNVSEGELADWCRERMANYKVPKKIHVRSSLPMLSIGKVDKIALRSSC